MEVSWIKCTGDSWCPLKIVNLSGVTAFGVYVIWYEPIARGMIRPARQVVRLGQGNIKERLEAHRNDPVITKHSGVAQLLVTWAEVDKNYVDGVEKYLADTLNPIEGEAFPDCLPTIVNQPHW